jgi:Fe-S-cluster containining protein
MTTIEGYRIVNYLESINRADLLKKVKVDQEKSKYVPSITTNQMAQTGYEGKEIPEEDVPESVESCPILENDECPIYEVRPFGCRCMVSKHICKDKGYAQTDPFVVTVNNVFFQFLEHIDENGYFGNFSDVLMLIETKKGLLDKEKEMADFKEYGLLLNYPLSALLIPPEYREKIKSILESLQNIKVPRDKGC